MIARADALAALDRDSFDIVVVGGGITGAGVAFDAATRGYSVALVEKADFASGTSSRSSKLIHGGLRYLQNFDLGLNLYDVMSVDKLRRRRGRDGDGASTSWSPDRHRIIPGEEVLELLPA